MLKGGTWYLVAGRAGDGRGPRKYRVSRIHAAAVRAETSKRPAGFQLESFWTDYQRGHVARVYRSTATVRLDEQGRQLLFLLGEIPAREARAAMTEPDADGWSDTTVPIESVRHAQHALLQLGEHVEVLAPAELRTAIVAAAHEIVARYG